MNTWREDLREKRRLYARLGVRECFLFDSEGEYLRPRLIGFRLLEGRYEPIEPDANERLRSEELNRTLKDQGIILRLFDHLGAPVPTRAEHVEQASQHVKQERVRADSLAAEGLKALLAQARIGADSGGPGSPE